MALVVVVLGLLAVSPDAHRWIHGHDSGPLPAHAGCDHDHDHDRQAESEDGCVVELFAQGIEAGLADAARAVCGRVDFIAALRPYEERLLASPRYLRQPERGPPV